MVAVPTSDQPPVTLILASHLEDDQVIRHALTTFNRERGRHRQATSLAEGCRVLEEEPVDLVLIDIRFPSEAMLAAILRFRQLRPSLRIVAFAEDQGLSTCVDVISVPSRRAASHPSGHPEIHPGDGQPRDLSRRLDDCQMDHGQPLPRPACAVPLSERQMAILKHLAEGLSVKEIASRLRMSYKSVDSLKYRMMRRLRIHDRVDLTRFAIREGLVTP